MERVFQMHHRHTGTGRIGFAVLRIGLCGKVLHKPFGTFQTQTAARDKAHIITGKNDRTYRKDSGVSCGIGGLVIGHLCRHFPKGGFKIVLNALAEAAQLVAAGVPAFGF